MLRPNFLLTSVFCLAAWLYVADTVWAQNIPDNTLGSENSLVTREQLINGVTSDVVSGGAIRNTSLFHSFQQFNVDAGKGVYFTQPTGIENILTRVTGNNPSNVLGTLGVLGNANLFLLNPNGIVFGENARLDIGGSFLATSADSFELLDRTSYSATNPEPVPLLTVALPAGLTFTGRSGRIIVRGTGHDLIDPPIPALPANMSLSGNMPTGLSVSTGRTLGLVGGDVTFTGGVATAPSGQIEIAGIESGKVGIQLHSTGFSLDYSDANFLNDVTLEKRAFLNASGTQQGTIRVFGSDITLTDGSLIYSENQGLGVLDAIEVNASKALKIVGTTQFTPIYTNNFSLNSGLYSLSSSGKGADIKIKANDLLLQDVGRVLTEAIGSGQGGNIEVAVGGLTQLLGPSPLDPNYPAGSFISSTSALAGLAGNVTLTTGALDLQNGSAVASSAFGQGRGGNVLVDAFESIRLSGVSSTFIPSAITANSFGSGDAGNLVVNTGRLSVVSGGRVGSATLSSGSSGSVTINSRDLVEVIGTVPGSINPSVISSSATFADPVFQAIFGLPAVPTGSSRDVTINTSNLVVSDGGQITVRNDGKGPAGQLEITATNLLVERKGEITASTRGGDGGNINLVIGNRLLLQDAASISAAALGQGNGGNITIDPNAVILLGGSRISANAEQGQGGQVSVTTRGLFVSADSAITATSERGPEFNGVVELNTSQLEFSRATAQSVLGPQSPEIATACSDGIATKEASLVNAGPGGLPPNPLESLNPEAAWRGHQPQRSQGTLQFARPVDLDEMPEVQGWLPNGDGTVRLVARMPEAVPQASPALSACR